MNLSISVIHNGFSFQLVYNDAKVRGTAEHTTNGLLVSGSRYFTVSTPDGEYEDFSPMAEIMSTLGGSSEVELAQHLLSVIPAAIDSPKVAAVEFDLDI